LFDHAWKVVIAICATFDEAGFGSQFSERIPFATPVRDVLST
jgi:hypothetical protein